MKRKELIAAVLFAAVLTGCTPGASKELAGNESSQEISIDNTVEAAIEASSEVVVEAPVEVSVDESVAEASVEEIKAERPEKANSDYPFLFIDANWNTSKNISVNNYKLKKFGSRLDIKNISCFNSSINDYTDLNINANERLNPFK